jgi:hypothetical protein
MAKDEKESPLRRMPFRLPGQSLQEEIDRIHDDKALDLVMLAAFLIAVAGMEWCRWLLKFPPQPWLFSLFALLGTAYAAYKLKPILRQLKQLKLGRDGEKVVGQELEKLRAKGYRVYHDFLDEKASGEKFNIDHIIIGSTGVFTVNTKTLSKPKGAEARIAYDGETVTLPGGSPDPDPIVQARAERDSIRRFIKKNANRDVSVRPAVVFVGWYTQRRPEGADVWVLNETAILSFIENEHSTLSEDDIVHISGILENHILMKQQALYG